MNCVTITHILLQTTAPVSAPYPHSSSHRLAIVLCTHLLLPLCLYMVGLLLLNFLQLSGFL